MLDNRSRRKMGWGIDGTIIGIKDLGTTNSCVGVWPSMNTKTGFIGELYYVFWWKKRFRNRENQDPSHPTTEPSYLFCWKSPIGSNRKQELPIKRPTNGPDQDFQVLRNYNGEEGIESELMRLHNLCGPPRFLFTIKEETKEDLESEDGRSRGEISFSRKGSRSKSLGELLACVDTPYLTPLASPSLKSQSLECYNHQGFNPLFESSTDTEINKLRFSPPPKFKFLRDAEEKLMKKLMEAAERKCIYKIEEKDVSIVSVLSETKQVQSHSTASSQDITCLDRWISSK
ncbi:uncharacterized protein LOC141696909 [Apium graveolens]|uniref:uncharacterized protein LOC141696909 n=1 Tax=Apium graveolens TaxID=4045 RepID=UPI003D7BA520